MKKKILVALMSLALALPSTSFAHGELWYDAASHLPQLRKIAVYPLKGKDGEFQIDKNEKSEVYQMNDFFDKRFVRKLKINTIPLGSFLKENKEIRTDEEKYKSLYKDFPSEKERAAAVAGAARADGYIVPQINIDYTEPHVSPKKTVTVEMKSYTKEIDGPNGDRTYNEKTWKEQHTIPEEQLMLYHFGLRYTMFDREGKKIMTYRNAEHTYGENYGGITGALTGIFGGKQTHSLKEDRYRVEMFKHIVNEFRKDFQDIQKNFKDNKKKVRVKKCIGFKEIQLPQNVGENEYSLKSIYFSMKDLAFKYTDLEIDYNGSGKAKYFVEGKINSYSLNRSWMEPYATTYESMESEEKSDWTDSNGDKHTKKIQKYVTKITDHHGYFDYKATVSGTFRLVDDAGKVLITYSDTKTNDKVTDAYRDLLQDFYGQVNNLLAGKKR